MLHIFFYNENSIQKAKGKDYLSQIPLNKILWVDLLFHSDEEMLEMESMFQIDSKQLKAENALENNARFYESEDLVFISANFTSVNENYSESIPAYLYLLKNVLITERTAEISSFDETIKKMFRNSRAFRNGSDVLEGILETKVDLDADFIEYIAREIASLSSQLHLKASIDKGEVLLRISKYQESTTISRESFIDKQRVVSALLKTSVFEHTERFRILITDINAMLEYTSFILMRLEFLQNTLLGLINIDQNKTIKIFTIVAVVFMPPTLIASIYGMNFRTMPELHWIYGYPLAIILILGSSMLTLLIFKQKKWF